MDLNVPVFCVPDLTDWKRGSGKRRFIYRETIGMNGNKTKNKDRDDRHRKPTRKQSLLGSCGSNKTNGTEFDNPQCRSVRKEGRKTERRKGLERKETPRKQTKKMRDLKKKERMRESACRRENT